MQVLENLAYFSNIQKNNLEMSMTLQLVLSLDHRYLNIKIRLLRYRYGTQLDKSLSDPLRDHIIKGIDIIKKKIYWSNLGI